MIGKGKFVFTGPPSSGKTTILNKYDQKVTILKDTAREILENSNVDIYGEHFSDMIFEKQLDKENVTIEELVFLDMSIIECLIYRMLKKQNLNLLKNIELKNRYTAIFLFKPLIFVNDGIRNPKDKENQKKIYYLMKKVYSDLGYEVIEIPVMSTTDRFLFINKELKRFGVYLC